jgi:microcystin-dependent protein
MGTPFMSEIRMFGFNFAPKGWAQCNGQLMQINQNQALFSLLGTTFGGNGQTTFALPDLRGRVPISMGAGYNLGERAGEAAHTLTVSELPAHFHGQPKAVTGASNQADKDDPTGNLWTNSGKTMYTQSAPSGNMSQAALGKVGGSQPHENMSPYLCVNFCICLTGVFPSHN